MADRVHEATAQLSAEALHAQDAEPEDADTCEAAPAPTDGASAAGLDQNEPPASSPELTGITPLEPSVTAASPSAAGGPRVWVMAFIAAGLALATGVVIGRASGRHKPTHH